jgi:hypothetical protein
MISFILYHTKAKYAIATTKKAAATGCFFRDVITSPRSPALPWGRP